MFDRASPHVTFVHMGLHLFYCLFKFSCGSNSQAMKSNSFWMHGMSSCRHTCKQGAVLVFFIPAWDFTDKYCWWGFISLYCSSTVINCLNEAFELELLAYTVYECIESWPFAFEFLDIHTWVWLEWIIDHHFQEDLGIGSVGTGLASHQTHWTQSKQPGSGKKLVLKWPKRLSHISHGASHLAVTYLLVLWRLNGFFLWARFTALCYSTEVQSLQSDKDYLVMYYRMY